jgi:hypothetical protein
MTLLPRRALPEDITDVIPGVGRFDPPPTEEPAWKTNPRLHQEFSYGGQVTRLYTIGALASALGKRPVTIRKWIRQGVIPEAGLKTQPITKTLGDAGRRLFSEEQIEALIKIAKESGVWGEGRRVMSFSNTDFSVRVWSLWRQKDW